MRNKSNPGGFRWLPLVAGMLVLFTMTLTLGEIAEDISNHEPLTVADVQLSLWLHAHQLPLLTKAMLVATFLGSTAAVTVISFAFGFYLIRRRRFYWLAALLLSVFGGMLLNRTLKYAFHRPRPLFDNPILSLTSYSFPSGHTMAATVLYSAIAAYLVTTTSDWRPRALIICSASFLILLVGFSRIYLGAHYLSDVLGAMAEGLAWLSLCLTVIHFVWRRRSSSVGRKSA